MKKVKCELEEAKKAVNEAWVEYYGSIRKWSEAMHGVDLTNYIPAEIPEELIEDILKKSPDMTELKLGYEIACHYWRVRCEADEKCVVAEKAIDVAREVLRRKEEELKKLKDSLNLK